ncbi:MAG: glycoside hydrolase family 20 zincin-like fold domain-containing protein, partial [Spirochaetota bacterium]
MAPLVFPRSVTPRSGSFSFGGDCTIAGIHDEDRLPARQLIDELAPRGCRARFATRTDNAGVVVRRKRAIANPEGYELSIAPERIMISAPTAAGAYYAMQTLREIVRAEGPTLAAREIADEPDFPRRGFYLDCSRGKVPEVDTIRELVEWLAHWKLNELQLYVENVFTFASHPRIGEGYSPFTPEDIRAIGEHCRLHHVRLVPSLTSLGHFEKILMLPEYADLGELPGFRDLPGGTTINPLDPRSLELVADMYDEFVPLFDAVDFNVCGDEPWELGQGRSKAKADEVGVGRVYLDWMLELRRLSVRHGRRMNMWGDIVLKHPEIIPELPPEIVLLNWDYTPNGRMLTRTNEFAEAGLPLVCCPGTNGWQSHGTRLGVSMRNIHQFVGIAREYRAEGILNTDWGDGGHRNTLGVSLHGAAYGAACSWNYGGTPGPESDEFTQAFTAGVFGDESGALASYLQTIGDDEYGQWAYHALLES